MGSETIDLRFETAGGLGVGWEAFRSDAYLVGVVHIDLNLE